MWHHHGSDTPTSHRAILHHTDAILCTILHTTVGLKYIKEERAIIIPGVLFHNMIKLVNTKELQLNKKDCILIIQSLTFGEVDFVSLNSTFGSMKKSC